MSRAVILWSGFEVPVLQREFFYEGELDRVDFFFKSVRAIGESDGWGKYNLEDPAEAANKLKDEKRREDRLRRHQHPFARWEMRGIWKVTPSVRRWCPSACRSSGRGKTQCWSRSRTIRGRSRGITAPDLACAAREKRLTA
ncbi:hypothetical protein ACTU6V_14470 [Microbacterium sp. A204]|uniref:hypothetical protein n=1 Tax=Microbacterium sp. A204 TaxID=3457321 RepID=UPI003FD1BF6C